MTVRDGNDDIAKMVNAVLNGRITANLVPSGFEPVADKPALAGFGPGDIPQTIDQLGELISYTYDLTITRAAELGIPVAGSVSGGFDRRAGLE